LTQQGRYISDLETDGLMDVVSKVHCAVLKNIDTGEVRGFRPHEIEEYLDILQGAEEAWFHNGIGYDEKVLAKLFPDRDLSKVKFYDTMVLGYLVYPDIKQTDFERWARWKPYAEFLKAEVKAEAKGEEPPVWKGPVPPYFPGDLMGRHSLKAWGCRLGNYKGDYDGGWDSFNEDMFDYMLQDAEVTYDLYHRLMAHEPSPQALELEHRIHRLCDKIQDNGFPFDMEEASKFLAMLVDKREALHRELKSLFPNWRVRLPDFIPKRPNKTKGYLAGVPVERWKDVEFNPTSRDHIEYCLKAKYNWKPKEFTDGGKATIDEDVLASLPYPEAAKLAEYFTIDKRISQLAEGDQAWMKLCKGGKIHARYTPNGANTGRATHSKPNISAVPRVSSVFGRECRALFHAPTGWVQVGADQQGLELRCLASDLAPFDNGEYAKVVCEGDVHTTNRIAFGLHLRDSSKTAIYAVCYGAGDEKLGTVAVEDARKAGEKVPTGKLTAIGKAMRDKFETDLPAYKQLVDTVKRAAGRGWIKGIDKRKINIRATHAALNTRLQSAGAVICKQWGCDLDDALKAKGLKHGWDGDYVFLSWSHDEYQLAVINQPLTIEIVKEAAIETGRNAGKPFNFMCPLDVDVKVGANWAECH
jgi:DNA polymerase-1